MNTRILIMIGAIGVIILGSVYVYSQMYDCLNPPPWMKVPFFGFEKCFQLFINGNLPDWTQAKEEHEEEQALRTRLIEQFKDKPEVVAFYSKYDDVNISIKDDHISYFSGSDDDYLARMNMIFDENHNITNIDFHCYFQRTHQYEFPQEDIAAKISKYDCQEHGKTINPEPEPAQRFAGTIKVEGEMAEKICKIIGGDCLPYYIGNPQPDGSLMVGFTLSDTVTEKQFIFLIKDGSLSYNMTENEN